ncbi:MAG: phosphopyruvate hydratase [Methanomassiliicoccales archaeon]|nr:phosphopyruvate hydratase [Methanomassiliicoccales archaeon]
MILSGSKIVDVRAREVLDSRGNPTVEAQVSTSSFKVTAIAPSGASTGSHEVLELRDGGERYLGKGVLKAVENVNKRIAPKLKGMDAEDLQAADQAMIDLDGTPYKKKLGGNAVVAVSLAVAKAGALSKGVELYEHLGPGSCTLPIPMMNIINGGKHAGTGLRIQEFMIVPAGAKCFADSLRMGAEVYHTLKSLLKEQFGPGAINLGDEGGFAPPLEGTRQALDLIVKGIEKAGYVPGKDVFLALDCAASEFCNQGVYELDKRRIGPVDLMEFYFSLAKNYPLVSIEDPFHEEAFDMMSLMTMRIGHKLQVVGDDMFVTNVQRIRMAIERKAGNATLLKVNQIGTVSEAIDAARLSFDNGYRVVVSHRSGETEDTSIADLTVALGCGQIKTGAPARGERTAKYNRLLRIEDELGSKAKFPGAAFYAKKKKE